MPSGACRVFCWTERDGRIARGKIAQVGEWLKPTDCKSVPPSEVRRFESFPVHQNLSWLGLNQRGCGSVISVNRLFIAMICYVVLGVLTWATITDPKIRMGTLLILALFAVKTLLRRRDVPQADVLEDEGSKAE